MSAPERTVRELFASWGYFPDQEPLARHAHVMGDLPERPAASVEAMGRTTFSGVDLLVTLARFLLTLERIDEFTGRRLLELDPNGELWQFRVNAHGQDLRDTTDRLISERLDAMTPQERAETLAPWVVEDAGELHYAELEVFPGSVASRRALDAVNGPALPGLVKVGEYWLQNSWLLTDEDPGGFGAWAVVNETARVVPEDTAAVLETARRLWFEDAGSLEEAFTMARALERT